MPVAAEMAAKVGDASKRIGFTMHADTERTMLQIAAEANVSPEAIQLIYCLFKHLQEKVQTSALDERQHRSAAELCDGLTSYAQQIYRESYRDVLRALGLDNSEKLGRVIYKLVEHSWVQPTDTDQESDFSGKFNLSEVAR